MLSSENELVLAYRTTDSVEIRALASQLEDADIPTQLVGDFRDGPGLVVGSMADKELWVSERERPAAEAIVAQWRRDHHPKDLEPAEPLRFSLWTAMVALSVAALSCALAASYGPRALGFAISAVPTLMFVYYAQKRLLQTRGERALGSPKN